MGSGTPPTSAGLATSYVSVGGRSVQSSLSSSQMPFFAMAQVGRGVGEGRGGGRSIQSSLFSSQMLFFAMAQV